MVISRDSFDPAKRYRRIRFHEDRQLLDSELNELQEIQDLERTKLVGQVFGEGAIVQGCAAAVGGTSQHVLTIAPGLVCIAGHIEPVPAAQLEYDPGKTAGEDLVFAELLMREIDISQDPELLNTRTLEPTAERQQWTVELKAVDTSGDPLPEGATERVVVPVMIFDRAEASVRPAVPRSAVQFDHLADAAIDSPEGGQMLRYDGATQHWRNTGLPELKEIADVDAPAPTDRQLLRFDQATGQWAPSNENTDADTVDGIHASTQPAAGKLLPLNANAKFPAAIIEGSVASANNADTVDGFHASATPQANTLLPLNASAKIPGTVISGQVPSAASADQAAQAANADKVDGFHASATATANTILPLDASAKIPGTVISGQVPSAANADQAAQAANADKVDGFHASSTPTANTILPLNTSAKIPGTVISGQVPSAAQADQATQATNADTVDGFHASSTATANTILPLNASAKIPGTVISGQVPSAANADQATQATTADKVDNFHASSTPAANTILPLNASAKIPGTVISGQVPSAAQADQATQAAQATQADNADKVDGFHASSTPTANTLLPLNASAKIPGTVISGLVPNAAYADDANYAEMAGQAEDANTVDGFHADSTPLAHHLLALDASATLNMGGAVLRNVGRIQTGSSTYQNYHRIGTNTSNRGLSNANDLLVTGKLEVDGQTWFDQAVTAAGNLTVAGNLTGYRCMLLCGYKPANTLRGDTGYYWNLQSPLEIHHGINNGMHMPRAGSVTGLVGRYDLLSRTADNNLKLEIIIIPDWGIQTVNLTDTVVQNGIPIGPVTWNRGVFPFAAGRHIWVRLHQAGPSTSQGQVANVEVFVEFTFD